MAAEPQTRTTGQKLSYPVTSTRKTLAMVRASSQQSLVEGVNSPSRGAAVYSPGPVFLERGQGSHVWDADGNEYIDFMMSFGALIQGHAHPDWFRSSPKPWRKDRISRLQLPPKWKRRSDSAGWFLPLKW